MKKVEQPLGSMNTMQSEQIAGNNPQLGKAMPLVKQRMRKKKILVDRDFHFEGSPVNYDQFSVLVKQMLEKNHVFRQKSNNTVINLLAERRRTQPRLRTSNSPPRNELHQAGLGDIRN